MAEHDATPSARRFALRAALLVVPLAALALAAPRVIAWLKRDQSAGLGVLYADRSDDRPRDRPATSAELDAAHGAERRLAEAEARWRDGTAIAPSEAAPDASGEKVRWFAGFGLSVESTPAGAQVLVDGRDLGRTPLVTSVSWCDPGDEVRVEVRKPPRRPQQRTTTCRKDQLVELRFGLE